MLPSEIIVNIGKYLQFKYKIELKKTCKFLSRMIKIRILPGKYLDKITYEIAERYPSAISVDPVFYGCIYVRFERELWQMFFKGLN